MPATGCEDDPRCALLPSTTPARVVHKAREFAGKARQILTRRT